jgi:ornithine cyclodeaminase/alanine dehydrogenase-like protein (mu-crystallin family)
MKDCISWLDESFKAYAAGNGRNLPRARVRHPSGVLHVLPAADLSVGAIGLKTYTSGRGGTRFLVVLSSVNTGELLALIEADYLGQMRTGAATGLATKYMARLDARRVGIYGTGSQGRTQLVAVAAVRKLESATAWSRDERRREQFCREMSAELSIPVRPAAAAEEAARGQDVVVTITTARDPVLRGEWLEPGVHVNAAGSNSLLRRELDDAAIERANRIVIDSRVQARLECGDLLSAAERGVVDWDRLTELADVVSEPSRGRGGPHEITLFESLGLGLEDVTVAMRVYERARAASVGQEVELFADVKPRSGR